MRYNDSSLNSSVFGKVVSILVSCLLTFAMLPVISLKTAFAIETSANSEVFEAGGEDSAFDPIEQLESSGLGGDDASEDVTEENPETLEVASSAAEVEESPAESFRFRNGQLIYEGDGNLSLRSIGTNYPNTFVRYDQGNHTRSDALCGIDVSYWNGSHSGTGRMIDWSRVKAAGIDFAIIRSSDGFTFDDDDFVYNVKGCIANGIPFGVYHYARATNAAEANSEADHVFRRLSAAGVTPSNITYPIYYDIENSGTPNYWGLGQGVVNTIASTFISCMNSAGYKAGVYSSTSWYGDGAPCGSSYINSLEYRWCAQYNSAGLTYSGFGSGGNGLMSNGKGMWQFTSQGYVDGISGYVDLNYSYLGGKYEASGKVSVSNIDKDGGTFRVTLSDIKSNRGIYRIEFAVWCHSSNGQDDLRWYGATRNSDGSYYADIAIKDHKGYTGTYVIHSYVYTRAGQSVGDDGSMGISETITLNPKQMRGPDVSADNLTVTAELKGGEYARATAVRISATLRSPISTSSISASVATQGSPIWFDVSKKGSSWPGVLSVHHLRVAGTYDMEVWATINGKESKVDQASFTISSYTDPGVTMYRLYNRITSEHFYTSNTVERDSLVKGDWVYEGVGWIAASGGTPVYRLYNKGLGDHHYTLNAQERDALVRYHGWIYEGIGWYTDGDIPIYRQYNGGLRVGQHHYTANMVEYKTNNEKNGWVPEGIGWYALRMN